MEKTVSRIGLGMVFLFLLILLSACSGTLYSVDGTWVVKEYEINGEAVPISGIREKLGETAEQNHQIQLHFTSTGELAITAPDYATGGTNESQAAYTVQDGRIEVFDPEHPSDFEILEYDGTNIRIPFDDAYKIVMKRK